MENSFEIADVNTAQERVTFVGTGVNLGRFGLAVKRRWREQYWCLYISLTQEEFNTLRSLETIHHIPVSFLGIASDSVYVSSVLSSKLMIECPRFFAGTDLAPGHAVDEETVKTALTRFADSVISQCIKVPDGFE